MCIVLTIESEFCIGVLLLVIDFHCVLISNAGRFRLLLKYALNGVESFLDNLLLILSLFEYLFGFLRAMESIGGLSAYIKRLRFNGLAVLGFIDLDLLNYLPFFVF